MSVLDKFLNVMRLNPEDEDEFYNEDYDYEDEEDFEEEPVRKKSSFRRERDEDEYYEDEPKARERQVKSTPKITPIRSSRKQGAGMEVCVIKPTSVEDAREITETLLDNRTVVLNVEGLNVEIAQRIIDFASGSCYAIHGNLQKISNYIFILTPATVDISGDFQSIVDSFDVPGIQTEF